MQLRYLGEQLFQDCFLLPVLMPEGAAKTSFPARALSRQSLMALPFSLNKRSSFINSSIDIHFFLEKGWLLEQITLNSYEEKTVLMR